jgi:lysophospholipase L1-like esterase
VSLTEAATAGDAVQAIAQRVAALSESLAAADAITVSAIRGATLAESASAADLVNWGSAFYSVDVAETATLVDAITAGLQALAAMSETAGANDLPMVALSARASVTEILIAADAVAGVVPGVFSAALTESGAAVDILVAVIAGEVILAGRFFSPSRSTALVSPERAASSPSNGVLESPPRRVLLVPLRRLER